MIPQGPSKSFRLLRLYELSSSGALYPVYMRGEGYLAAHRGNEAAADFQKNLNHRGIVVNAPIGALAHLGQAAPTRCREIKPGQRLPTRISSPSGRAPILTSPS